MADADSSLARTFDEPARSTTGGASSAAASRPSIAKPPSRPPAGLPSTASNKEMGGGRKGARKTAGGEPSAEPFLSVQKQTPAPSPSETKTSQGIALTGRALGVEADEQLERGQVDGHDFVVEHSCEDRDAYLE